MAEHTALHTRKQAATTPAGAIDSSFEQEYQALNEGAALLDRSAVGRLSLTGQDALDLLNRLSTNELMTLEAGQGAPTVLTSNKGRILDLLLVLRLADRLLVLTSPENRQKVADWIDFYTFVEDVTVRDVTEEEALLSVAGPGAGALLDELTGQAVSSLGLHRSIEASIGGVEATVARTDFVRLPGYDLVVAAAQRQQLWGDLIERGRGADLRPVGTETLEVARVEQGVPAYGAELSEDFNPLEAGLKEFISFTKGCYVGQEVVARLDTYDKVQKRLVGLRWDAEGNPTPGAKLVLDGKQVGVMTSAVRSPRMKAGIGLGYVRKTHVQPGTVLPLETADGWIDVEVAELPFRPAGS